MCDGGSAGVVYLIVHRDDGVLAGGEQAAPLQHLHEVHQRYVLAQEHVYCGERPVKYLSSFIFTCLSPAFVFFVYKILYVAVTELRKCKNIFSFFNSKLI